MYTFYLPKVKASGKATISIVAKTGQQLNHPHKLKHTFAAHNQTNMLRQENTYKTIYTYKAFIIHLVIDNAPLTRRVMRIHLTYKCHQFVLHLTQMTYSSNYFLELKMTHINDTIIVIYII